MYARELEIGDVIQIYSHKDNSSVNLSTKVIEKRDHKVILDAVRVDGNVILFDSLVVINDLQYTENARYFVAKDVRILNLRRDDGPILIIDDNVEFISSNKRSAKRYHVGKQTQAQIGISKKIVYASLMDVSLTGFCIKSSIEAKNNMEINLVFSSDDNELIRVTGRCVRVIYDNLHDIYTIGCRVSRDDKSYRNFIMNMERNAMKLHSDRNQKKNK